MENPGSNLPSDVLWTILASSVASLALLFVGLYFAKKANRRQERKGKGRVSVRKPASRAKAKPKDRGTGANNK